MKENESGLYATVKKDLENDLNQLKKANKSKIAENEEKIKKLESKLTKFYYWLFGIALVLFGMMAGMFFYFRGSLGS